jgi:hypothetical protein
VILVANPDLSLFNLGNENKWFKYNFIRTFNLSQTRAERRGRDKVQDKVQDKGAETGCRD